MVDLDVDLRRARRDAASAHPHRRRVARRARSAQAVGGRAAMSLLEVRALSIHFGPRKVVDNVSFSLEAGEKLALVGESASGKTVTALSALRLIENARSPSCPRRTHRRARSEEHTSELQSRVD